ncbi:MAG: iron chelate uptake ABC transporter family permease subunit, partial [Microbacteriaceae bacterium]|nr:iron chelate uptake ABC transporter family permease subunit [Microbacteriaceae bacterium]
MVLSSSVSETQLTQSRVRLRTIILSTALGLILVAAVIVSAITGQLAISPSDVVGSLLKWMGIANSWAPADPVIGSTLQVVRFPRIVMALAVGAALAVAGALMQAVFGNPLAEPGVVGVSSGA